MDTWFPIWELSLSRGTSEGDKTLFGFLSVTACLYLVPVAAKQTTNLSSKEKWHAGLRRCSVNTALAMCDG